MRGYLEMGKPEAWSGQEQRLQETIKTMQTHNLQQQQEINGLKDRLDKICDDLINVGTDMETVKAYWPDYKTQAEKAIEKPAIPQVAAKFQGGSKNASAE